MQLVFGLSPTIPCPDPVPNQAWVYILHTADGSYYVGHTVHLRERTRKHRLGLGSKHARDHVAPRLIFCEGPLGLVDAIKCEAQLKRWSRSKKEALIRGDLPTLKTLSRSRAAAPGRP